jgi:hypothetical protein
MDSWLSCGAGKEKTGHRVESSFVGVSPLEEKGDVHILAP